MDDTSLAAKIENLIVPIVEEEGLKLWDVIWLTEMGRKVLRVMVEKETGGVSVEDCTRLSHAIEDLIEVKDLIPARYDLEVSSPGLDRPLKKKEHFEKAVGQLVSVKTKGPVDGRRVYKGVVEKVEGDEFIINVDNQPHRLPISEVAKANIVFVMKKNK